MKEIEYIEIPGFPRYYAGSDGEIYSRNYKKNKNINPIELRKLSYGRQRLGYHIVNLKTDDGKCNMCRVHVLICTAFKGNRPKGMQCSHLNDDKENNRPENLNWETDSENKKRKYINNGGDRGIKNSRSIFTEEDIRKVRGLLSCGKIDREIAEIMNCSRISILRIRTKRRYKEVT